MTQIDQSINTLKKTNISWKSNGYARHLTLLVDLCPLTTSCCRWRCIHFTDEHTVSEMLSDLRGHMAYWVCFFQRENLFYYTVSPTFLKTPIEVLPVVEKFFFITRHLNSTWSLQYVHISPGNIILQANLIKMGTIIPIFIHSFIIQQKVPGPLIKYTRDSN